MENALMSKRKVAFWRTKNPDTTPDTLSPKQKATAKARAKAAGRPYPNLVDNAAAAKRNSK
jgi:hypothetical protein